MSDKTPGPDTDSLPLDETGQVIVPDYDNRKNTELFNLEDIQAFERELWAAKQEGREPTLEDPRKRVYGDVVPPLIEQPFGGAAATPGVSNSHVGVVSPGVNQVHPLVNEADVNVDPEPEVTEEAATDEEVVVVYDESTTDSGADSTSETPATENE